MCIGSLPIPETKARRMEELLSTGSRYCYRCNIHWRRGNFSRTIVPGAYLACAIWVRWWNQQISWPRRRLYWQVYALVSAGASVSAAEAVSAVVLYLTHFSIQSIGSQWTAWEGGESPVWRKTYSMQMRMEKGQPRRRSLVVHNYVLHNYSGLPTMAAHQFSHLPSLTMLAMMKTSLDGKSSRRSGHEVSGFSSTWWCAIITIQWRGHNSPH